jgi:GDPmannose 4,6-dehydratase
VGNLAAQRDWGFAPDYVEGMLRVARQVSYRAKASNSTSELDAGSNYRDYILASGQLHAVWELVDRAFELAGLPLEWKRKAADAADWSARLAATGADAVVVDRRLIRPSDPIAISANPARAREELGWEPRPGLDVFLTDMLGDQS